MKNIYTIFFLLFIYSIGMYGQDETITVKGLVTDEKDEPLAGVNIIVKNDVGVGVVTDINGNYQIKVKPYSTLVYSYIGFESAERVVKEKVRTINVKLKESSESVLDEVVVTGMGTMKKVTLTGAITTADVSTLKTPTASITNSLAGNVAGVMARQRSGQPGMNNSEFWIRGISTFGVHTSAVVLVDGFERSMDEISVEDIESFSVLKDAAATAIYGSRGANGVVLITTKHGKPGKITVNAKAEMSYSAPTKLPEYVDGPTYASLLNESLITRNRDAAYTEEELYMFKSGLDPDLYPNVNWRDVMLKKITPSYRANIDISGGGSNARYFVSASYYDESCLYKIDKAMKDYETNASYKRWNYRMNFDMNLTKTTLINVGVSGSLEKQNEPGFGADKIWSSMVGMSPVMIPLYYSDGRIPTAGGEEERFNPWVLCTQTGYQEKWNNTIQTNVTLHQNLDFVTKGLRFTGRFGFDTYNENNRRHYQWPEQWKAERQRDANGNIVYTRVKEEQLMKHEGGSSGSRKEFLEALLEYNRTFNNHAVGGTLKYYRDQDINTSGQGSYDWINRRHQGLAGRFTYSWKYRYIVDFNFGYNGSENFASGHQYGFFPAISAAWNVLEEPFLKKRLPWMDMLKLRYSYGKVGNDIGGVRFPYLAEFKTEHQYDWGDLDIVGNNNANRYKGLFYSRLASNNVTWEIATKQDVGVDMAMFGNKFTATVDYFHEMRDGIFMTRNYLPNMVGVNGITPQANVGKVKSYGFDGNLAYHGRINEVSFTLRGNFTWSQNEILEYDEQYTNYPYRLKKGYSVNQPMGYVALGLFEDYDDIRNSPVQNFKKLPKPVVETKEENETEDEVTGETKPVIVQIDPELMPGDIKYKDVNGDGVINEDDMVPIGSTDRPNFTYGFGLSLGWKGFDVNVHFQGTGRSSFFVSGKSVFPFSEGDWGNVLQDVVDAGYWKQGEYENPNAAYPRLTWQQNENNKQTSTFWMRNGSYLRLKTFEVGYTLPKEVVRKMHLGNMRFFFIGTNLLTFSKFKLWDPELCSSNAETYPLSRVLTLGLTVNI